MLRVIYFKLPILVLTALCIYLLVVVVPYPIYTISAIILLSVGLLAGFINYKQILLILFLVLPFSIEKPLGLGDSKIILPSELVLIILAVAFIVRFLFFSGLKRTFFVHPITVLILFYGIVMVTTSLTSSMLVVSLKFTSINLLYILVYYFLINIYINDNGNTSTLYYFYGISVFFVIVYTLVNHARFGFSKGAANVSVPFYSDHAIYSACLAMLFPAFFAFVFRGKKLRLSVLAKALSFLVLIAISVGLVFSYSRAAWISLAVSAFFFFGLLIRIKPVYLMLVILVVGIVVSFNRNSIIDSWKLNKYSSTSQNPTMEEETKSITNISNDVSNAERLNRWSCAYRMFLEQPYTGYGPGTYQFQYLKYQRPSEMTRISVMTAYNNPPGKGGSAHSEYLLALSESGIFGFIGVLGIVLFSVYYGMRAYYRSKSETDKIMVAVALLSVITYSTHVVFNNYLNIDKTASLFWMSICIIATFDSKNKQTLDIHAT